LGTTDAVNFRVSRSIGRFEAGGIDLPETAVLDRDVQALIDEALERGVFEQPVFPDGEPDIPELKRRIATTIAFIQGLRPAEINGTEQKEVVFSFRNGLQRKFTGQSLLLTFSVPQFFFHVTTAYDILRHCGVDLVKKDFLGTPGQDD
jgi:hypothetical protein